MALAATGAASIGVDYVKVSLLNFKAQKDATFALQNVVKAVNGLDKHVSVVAAGFADAERVASIDPFLLPGVAAEAECDFAMVDTAFKDGKNLFDFLSAKQLRAFADEAHDDGLKVAFAGSLKAEHLAVLNALGADIAGLRGAACTGSDRVRGHITEQKVRELVSAVKAAQEKIVTVR